MTNERFCPLHIGANILPQNGTHFRVWAPRRQAVEVVIEGGAERVSDSRAFGLAPEGQGYFSGLVRSLGAGALYRFRLDGGERLYPDPASRYQPEGPHGPSQVVDPKSFGWTDHDWPGVNPRGQVIYEMHIGTLTREGSWAAAARELDELARLGITVVEVMPVADFPGKFGWGYDSVNLFAPSRLYGSPDDFRRFVDRAHAAGLGVILDVVYNHFGNVDNYIGEFADNFKSHAYKNDWGDAINFDGENSLEVRQFVQANAKYWIEEFHLDGFRFDATQQI